MSLSDDVARARAVDEAIALLAFCASDTPTTRAAHAVVRDVLCRLTVENERLRSTLSDIAKAHPSECDQCPFWAKEAICDHAVRKVNARGENACVECWNVEDVVE